MFHTLHSLHNCNWSHITLFDYAPGNIAFLQSCLLDRFKDAVRRFTQERHLTCLSGATISKLAGLVRRRSMSLNRCARQLLFIDFNFERHGYRSYMLAWFC